MRRFPSGQPFITSNWANRLQDVKWESYANDLKHYPLIEGLLPEGSPPENWESQALPDRVSIT